MGFGYSPSALYSTDTSCGGFFFGACFNENTFLDTKNNRVLRAVVF